jgi:hypothetical protein
MIGRFCACELRQLIVLGVQSNYIALLSLTTIEYTRSIECGLGEEGLGAVLVGEDNHAGYHVS